GTITPPRGVLELVDAMSLLPDTLEARLVIGGEFEPPELEQEARKKPGWKRTDYAGWLNRRQVLDLLSRARIGVLPLLAAANHIEMQPIKLFEYMIAGLPVVASNLPQIAKIIEDSRCGILVDPGQP